MSKPVKTGHIVFGIHSVQALLNSAPQRVESLLLLQGRNDQRLRKLHLTAEKHAIPVIMASRGELDKLTDNHQGAIAMAVSAATVYDERHLEATLPKLTKPVFTLVLDGVTDPNNLGACLRSAEAAGVDWVITPKSKSASLTPAAIKVACGAADIVPLVTVTNLVRTLKWLKEKGVWVLGTAVEGNQYYYQADLSGPLALVVGAEGKGLRRLTRECCDGLIRIPIMGRVGSLNVSVAAGICLFEAVRQRVGGATSN